MSVLILSADRDWSADAVADQLAARGCPHVRVDPGDFPQRLRMAAELSDRSRGTLVDSRGHHVDLEAVTAVYYRRPSDFAMPEGMSGPELRFSRAQARIGVGGVLASLPVRWVNHPAALADAEYKPHQLSVAARLGLRVPASLVTNVPDAALQFAKAVGDVIVKPLAEPIVEEAGGHTLVWTRRLAYEDFADLDGVQHTAHLFQQWVPKVHEVRLTMIGRRTFAVEIYAGSEAAIVDWRSDYDALTYQPVECPAYVAQAAGRFLDAFRLRYGAFDFAVTEDGDWTFLECNGAGQWGWLAEECDLPIAAAIADDLTETPSEEPW